MAIVETLEIRDIGAAPTLTNVANASQKASDATKNVSKGIEEIGKTSGKVAGNMDKLASAIGLVSPQAATYVRDLAGVAKVSEVASTASAGLGLSMGSVLAVAGPVAVAVAALGAVYYALQRDIDNVTAANESLAASATAAQAEMEKLHRMQTGLADRAAIATGTETKAAQELRHAVVEVTAAYGPRIAAAQAALAEEEKARAAYGGTGEKLDRLQATLDGLNKEQGKYIQLAAQAALMEPPGASKKHVAVVKEQKSAYAELAGEIARVAPIQKTDAQIIADLQAKATAAKKAGTLSSTEYAKALDEISAAQGRLATGVATKAAEALAADLDAAVKSAEAMIAKAQEDIDAINADAQASIDDAAAARTSNQVAGAIGGPSAILSGIGNAGPIGAIIAAIGNLAGHFEDLPNMFSDFTVDINNSIAGLPKMLSSNIGRWIEDGTKATMRMLPDLINGLATEIPNMFDELAGTMGPMLAEILKSSFVELPKAMVSLVEMLVDADMWYGVGETMVKGFIQGFTVNKFKDENGQTTGASVGWGALSILTGGLSKNIKRVAEGEPLLAGSHDLGGYVSQPGLAMVHQGEWIQSAQGVNSGGGAGQASMARSSGGGDTHIHIHGSLISSVPELVRTLNREMTQSGLRWAA